MLITFTGLPGSGKSSTARALAQQLHAPVFLEPEEGEWPSLVHQREISGAFTAMSWFRSARVPGLFAAQAASREGRIAVVDSYFDKLTTWILATPSFSWLLPDTDPYFPVARQMAQLDYDLLPNADVLVLLKLEQSIWLEFMHARGRHFDQSVELNRFFGMQQEFEQAAQKTAADHNIRLCVIEQTASSPDQTATLIRQRLGL